MVSFIKRPFGKESYCQLINRNNNVIKCVICTRYIVSSTTACRSIPAAGRAIRCNTTTRGRSCYNWSGNAMTVKNLDGCVSHSRRWRRIKRTSRWTRIIQGSSCCYQLERCKARKCTCIIDTKTVDIKITASGIFHCERLCFYMEANAHQ